VSLLRVAVQAFLSIAGAAPDAPLAADPALSPLLHLNHNHQNQSTVVFTCGPLLRRHLCPSLVLLLPRPWQLLSQLLPLLSLKHIYQHHLIVF
jgi:hypothetical protein